MFENNSAIANGLSNHWYTYERGTIVYGSNPTYWIGKIGMIYPSDYGYATSGGITKDRTACLNKELSNWSDINYSDCKNNNFIYLNIYDYQWTITSANSVSSVLAITNNGGIQSTGTYFDNANYGICYYPTLFLNHFVLIKSGLGTQEKPFILSTN